jgi:hypothetical protein
MTLKTGFSTRELAALRLPGAPTSHQGWDKYALTRDWEIRHHHGRGRGGVVREFIPPAALAALIARHQAGEVLSEEEVRRVMTLPERKDKSSSRISTVRHTTPGPRERDDLTTARFSAWLMGRLITRMPVAALDERQQLDCHELALRLLLTISNYEGMSLASLMERAGVVDRVIDLVVTIKRVP